MSDHVCRTSRLGPIASARMATLASAFVSIACFLEFVDVRLEVLVVVHSTHMVVPVGLGVARQVRLSIGLLMAGC